MHSRSRPRSNKINDPTRSVDDLDEYFDALAADATTEKEVMEELVNANAALTTTNAELLASVAILIKANEKISCRLGNRCDSKNRTHEECT